MKRKLLCITLMILALTWGILKCQEARADHWRQDASLLPGTYMLAYFDKSGTDFLLGLQDYSTLHELESSIKLQYVIEAIVITINREYTTGKLVKFLNTEPETVNPILFKKVELSETAVIWKQIPMPWKLVAGDVTM